MILAASQPAFMPWAGYLDKVRQSDVFVVLAGVQFEKNSFTNRNQIRTENGNKWLTVPLRMKGHMVKSIADMQVDTLKPWRRVHLETIRHAYGKAPGFKENWPKIHALYENFNTPRFMEVFAYNFAFWLAQYGIGLKPSQVPFSNLLKVRTDELIGFCKEHDCDTYLSGTLGRNYLEEEKFTNAGIKLEYQDVSGFNTLSVLDAWMQKRELF